MNARGETYMERGLSPYFLIAFFSSLVQSLLQRVRLITVPWSDKKPRLPLRCTRLKEDADTSAVLVPCCWTPQHWCVHFQHSVVLLSKYRPCTSKKNNCFTTSFGSFNQNFLGLEAALGKKAARLGCRLTTSLAENPTRTSVHLLCDFRLLVTASKWWELTPANSNSMWTIWEGFCSPGTH